MQCSTIMRGFCRAQIALDKSCVGIVAIACIFIVAMLTGTSQNIATLSVVGAICAIVGIKFGQYYEKAKEAV